MVQLLAFLRRHQHLSFEEFDEMWTNHATLVNKHLKAVQDGSVKYKQFHVDPKVNAELRALGRPVLDHDGMVLWEAATLAEIFECIASPECLEFLRPDDARFLAEERVELVAGQFM
ncbi:BetaGal-dom2 domain-containing protein [Mycena indigotica]|uniref:BetaGal-dom2 domain-containing protein n=1 Tax=Mycena indigotica TaxID=2126181 RepID=A0A8H6W0V0_9AGAR|nr:BetaGal-dom2 domain-containing protein [Mycena indigotica]KAF7298906.1 BetaGal-dom2 domain-containing protein [Mycena indigotica]